MFYFLFFFLPRLQERLIKKLGGNSFPFSFGFPRHSPTSVTLQQQEGEGEEEVRGGGMMAAKATRSYME